MPYPFTIPDIINIGKLSAHLASVDVLNSVLYGRKLDPRLPLMLQMETDSIEWRYTLIPTDTSLIDTSNYLYELCGKYALQANALLVVGTGGTAISPITPSNYTYVSKTYVVTATDLGLGAPVDGATVWVNPIFQDAKEFTTIRVDNIDETVDVDFTFEPANARAIRNNPFFTGSTVVVSFLKKI